MVTKCVYGLEFLVANGTKIADISFFMNIADVDFQTSLFLECFPA